MPVGRPTKYNEEVLKKAKHYLENFKEYGNVIPSVCSLSLILDIRENTLYDWKKQPSKKAFSKILDAIKAKQKETLINNGLTGDFNSNITKLVLGKHGYHDRQELEHTGKDQGPIEVKHASLDLDGAKEAFNG